MKQNSYPAASAHDPIAPLFDDVYWVHGSVGIMPGVRMNRNMVILRQDGELSLISPVRLDDAGLAQLEQLGTVKRVIRLGHFHGMDDRFYVDRYQAEFWCQPGQTVYGEPRPSHPIEPGTPSPFRNSQFFLFETATCPEAALLLQDQRLLVTCDGVQHHSGWTYTTPLARLVLKLFGFKKALLIGGPWLKKVTPRGGSMRGDFERLLQLDFDHLISAHGTLLRGQARDKLGVVVQQTFG